MPLRLILTRHAKSDWDNPLQSDHQRPLNSRGQHAAPMIGRWLAGKGYLPQEALVSNAARTRETWALLSAELPDAVPAQYLPALYHASPTVMLRALHTAKAPCVIMIGHNPGIAEFAARLLRTHPAHPQFSRYPTCATLVVEFHQDSWADIRNGSGAALDFTVPRDLE